MNNMNTMEYLSILVDVLLKNVVLHPVKLVLIWNEIRDINKLISVKYEIKECDEFNLILKNIEENGWNAVVLPKQYLKVISKSTGNTDIRGGGCGEYKFKQSDFVWEVNNPNGITLSNLVEGVYRMKGSKYDLWYELFCNIELINEDENSYTIQANFGYGS